MDLKLTITPNQPSKLTGAEKSRLPDKFAAAIELNEENYTPEYVELRGRIHDTMITANLTLATLELLEADPKVVSVLVGGKMRPV